MLERPTAVEDDRVSVALDCVTAGIEAADPATAVPDHVERFGTDLVVDGDPYDLAAAENVLVVGGGNAAAVLAAALEDVLGDAVDGGAVVTDNPVGTDRIEILPGDHPVPSRRGVESTRDLLAVADSAGPDDLVLAVLTGGGSALLPAPVEGVPLGALQETTEALLASGASIDEINAVRKHCSAIKGGRLAALLAPATVVGVVVSDVAGNRLDVIASGPLTPDESTYEDALVVLERYDVAVPEAVEAHLRRGAAGARPETPGAGDPAFGSVHQYVVADGRTALRGAARAAEKAGYEPLVLGSGIRGDAREAGTVLAGVAEECVATGTPVAPPAVLLSGGETTVTVTGDGTGGPNQEFALASAIELESPAVAVASVDTDGIDGASTAAGGVATAVTADPEAEARAALADNDAGGFLDGRDALVVTGPTNTNVNDLRAFVVDES